MTGWGGEWLSERPELRQRGRVVQGKERVTVEPWGGRRECADVRRGEGGESVQAVGPLGDSRAEGGLQGCGKVLNHGGLWTS